MDREKLGFGLLLVVIAVVLLGFGWQTYQNQQADIGQAVEVDGTIQSTDVETLSTTDSSDDYSPAVEYTYSYEGQNYTSESVYPGPDKEFGREDAAREVLQQFTVGETTTVHVNEADPARAYLIETTSRKPLLAILSGVVAAVFGVLLLVFGVRE